MRAAVGVLFFVAAGVLSHTHQDAAVVLQQVSPCCFQSAVAEALQQLCDLDYLKVSHAIRNLQVVPQNLQHFRHGVHALNSRPLQLGHRLATRRQQPGRLLVDCSDVSGVCGLRQFGTADHRPGADSVQFSPAAGQLLVAHLEHSNLKRKQQWIGAHGSKILRGLLLLKKRLCLGMILEAPTHDVILHLLRKWLNLQNGPAGASKLLLIEQRLAAREDHPAAVIVAQEVADVLADVIQLRSCLIHSVKDQHQLALVHSRSKLHVLGRGLAAAVVLFADVLQQ